MKNKRMITIIILLSIIALSWQHKMKDYGQTFSNSKYSTSDSNLQNSMIPVASGIGGDVTIACFECQKLMSIFIKRCVDQEAEGQQADTFRTFCEYYSKNPSNNAQINPDACFILNAKLSAVSGENGNEVVDPTKAPNLCIKYQSQCINYGGAPNCYSGFCESVAECVDCPTALIDKNKNGAFTTEVCGGNGICKLGWKNANAKGGNGYCECKNGMKGLACNLY